MRILSVFWDVAFVRVETHLCILCMCVEPLEVSRFRAEDAKVSRERIERIDPK